MCIAESQIGFRGANVGKDISGYGIATIRPRSTHMYGGTIQNFVAQVMKRIIGNGHVITTPAHALVGGVRNSIVVNQVATSVKVNRRYVGSFPSGIITDSIVSNHIPTGLQLMTIPSANRNPTTCTLMYSNT